MSDDPFIPYNFTVRQRQVLQRIGRGMSYNAIAEDLGISPNTVKVHATMAAAKVGLSHLPVRAACLHYLVSMQHD